MRFVSRVALAFTTFALLAAAGAQAPPQQKPIRIPDGGVGCRMESIFVPPKAGAPFSFILATEWTRLMNNGGTFTLANERRITRDTRGRIYQERWILVPKGGKLKSFMDVFQITDPDTHTCNNRLTGPKICNLYSYRLTTRDNFQPPILTTGPFPDCTGYRQHEDLGAGSTEGVDTHGYRETVTFNPGTMGNDQPMSTVREFWYSSRLAVNLVSIVDDPQSGKQVFTAKEISTAEPDPSVFQVPPDYKVVNHLNDKD